jgi:hypothetical protein
VLWKSRGGPTTLRCSGSVRIVSMRIAPLGIIGILLSGCPQAGVVPGLTCDAGLGAATYGEGQSGSSGCTVCQAGVWQDQDGKGCDAGAVCSGGACRVGCYIGGQFFLPDAGPDCQGCIPSVSTTTFSQAPSGYSPCWVRPVPPYPQGTCVERVAPGGGDGGIQCACEGPSAPCGGPGDVICCNGLCVDAGGPPDDFCCSFVPGDLCKEDADCCLGGKCCGLVDGGGPLSRGTCSFDGGC